MPKVLIIDDDEMMRAFLARGLRDEFETFGTGNPEEALALTLERKPDVILLDLLMPKFSGFELCQTLHSLSYTSAIPVFVVSGEAGAKYRDDCEKLGARGYFQKPVNFSALKEALNAEIKKKPAERRRHVRVRMRISLRLTGTDINGNPFQETTFSEDVSAGGFLCQCSAQLWEGATVEVFLKGERYAGRAQVARKDSSDQRSTHYGFRFQEVTNEWVLQHN